MTKKQNQTNLLSANRKESPLLRTVTSNRNKLLSSINAKNEKIFSLLFAIESILVKKKKLLFHDFFRSGPWNENYSKKLKMFLERRRKNWMSQNCKRKAENGQGDVAEEISRRTRDRANEKTITRTNWFSEDHKIICNDSFNLQFRVEWRIPVTSGHAIVWH